MKKFLRYALLVALGVILGIVANRNREYLINAQFIRNHLHFRKTIDNANQIMDDKKTMVCLVIGQSNAADYGLGNYKCKNEVYNFYKGDLYKAKEPLLGADGDGSSVWTRVADMVIDSGLYSKAVIIPCAIGSTAVSCWSDGPCHEQLLKTLRYLKDKKVNPTHIFWLQGETDNFEGTTKEAYKKSLIKVIKTLRDNGIAAPFFTSITSYFPYNKTPFGISPAITEAQRETIKEGINVKAGPNTDSINLAYYRQADLHFTEKGLDVLAYKWFVKIKAAQ